MVDIPARELRNHIVDVLRRVEAGERLRVTVRGRPVAELAPLMRRPTSVRWEDLMRDAERWRADAASATDLGIMLPDTTDDDPMIR